MKFVFVTSKAIKHTAVFVLAFLAVVFLAVFVLIPSM